VDAGVPPASPQEGPGAIPANSPRSLAPDSAISFSQWPWVIAGGRGSVRAGWRLGAPGGSPSQDRARGGMATIRDKMGHCLHEFFTMRRSLERAAMRDAG